jgi:anaphase-promoting complex subunit 2
MAAVASADEAAQVLSQFWDDIEAHGVQRYVVNAPRPASTEELSWATVERALQVLRRRGRGGVVGAWYGQRLTALFRRHAVASFFVAAESDTAAALRVLWLQHDQYAQLLRRIAEQLQCASLAPVFTAAVRGDILHAAPPSTDPLSAIMADDGFEEHAARGEESPLMTFLAAHGERLLQRLAQDEAAFMAHDDVMDALHGLSLSSATEVTQLWMSVAAAALRRKLAAVAEEADGEYGPVVAGLLQWKERVLDGFARLALVPSARGVLDTAASARRLELERWSQHFAALLVDEFGAAAVAQFFNTVVDFPESMPALRDLAYCLRKAPALNARLVPAARAVLAAKLQHAGTQTEDVLTVLVSAVRALHVVYPRSEAPAAVAAICGATLQHLKGRADSVAAIVRDIVQPSGGGILQGAPAAAAHGADEIDESLIGGMGAPAKSDLPPTADAAPAAKADVLRVLLTALSLPAIVKEYRAVLADTLLRRRVADNTDAETEVLERMKSIFGEDVLAPSAVMLRDAALSKRLNAQIGDLAAAKALAVPTACSVLSATCWPAGVSSEAANKFLPHPQLAAPMAQFADCFKVVRPNQRLKYLSAHGTVDLALTRGKSVDDATPERLSVTLSVFVASVVLHLKAAPGPLAIDAVAAAMETTAATVTAQIQPHLRVIVVRDGDALSLQAYAVAPPVQFREAAAADEAGPEGVTPEELAMYGNMIFMMLKTGGAKKAEAIANSMRMFFKFQGTVAQAKGVMMYLVAQKMISTPDGGATFSVVKPPS